MEKYLKLIFEYTFKYLFMFSLIGIGANINLKILSRKTNIFGERINTDISKKIEQDQKEPPEGFDPNLWRKHIQNMPGGVINLNDKEVVSDSPAIAYEVLPKWAGFSKLAYEGAVVGSGSAVKIVKNIPYSPSGLYGGYSAEITVGKGVEPPKGIPGHSRVKSEETGKQIAGPFMGR